jgi:hypothetical protein
MKILKAGLRETPGIGSAMALHKLVKGEGGEKLTREEQNEEIGKIITSNLIAVPLVMLARAGFITGSGPKENDKRAALQETGWQAFSVKVGDRYISYARLEPFATPMGLVADFANIDWTKVKDKPEDVAWDVARSIQKNVTNKTFFEQLDNILSMFDEGGPAMERFAKRFLGSAIPNIVGRATSITDPNYRETRGLPAYMQGRVPGLSNALPPQRGLWGQERKKETGPVGFISPFMVSHVKNDPASIEVARLKLGFPRPDREIRGVKLTPAQYDDYAKTAGEMAHERVMRIIENPKYASLSDETKTEVLRGAVNESRANARNIIWTTHKLKPSETP